MRFSEWNISWWKTLGDIAFCSLLLRFLFAWWFANKRLGALILTVVGLAGLVWLVDFLKLPLATVVVLVTALPVALLLIISSIPDIRRAYHTASFQNLFSLKQTISEDLVQILATTVLELAQMRRGALLVFPQHDDIEPFLTGGEEYDSRVTRSLLISLLNPGAPRHDGAIVISNGKIIRVGAVLPIGSSDHAREEWGTRHLAALGLAEMCDARIVVVSEERGTISLAHDDEIDELPMVDDRTVTDLISSILYAHDRGEQQHVRFRHSLLLWGAAIIFSLIAAPMAAYLSLPVKVHALDSSSNIPNVPIFFTGVPEHLFIQSQKPDTCSVNLSLPSNEVSRANLNLNYQNLRVNVNLGNIAPGPTSITLTRLMISGLPDHWVVNSYTPEKIEVTLAEARRMNLPIEPNFSGIWDQLRVASFQCDPAEVDVIIKDDAPTKNRRLSTVRLNLGDITAPGTYHFKTQVEYPASVRPASGAVDTPVQVTFVLQAVKNTHK